jgi:hypothetical protein
MSADQVDFIARLNDEFREAGKGRGILFRTSGINAMNPSDIAAIEEKISAFKDFNDANDPYREHDFGVIQHNGQDIYFKFDYYAADLEHGSEDPADSSQTVRVMTVMLANEY